MLIPVCIVYVILIITGVGGNVIFILGALKSRKLQSALHYFILATAVCDLLLLLPQPIKLYMIFIHLDMTQAVCLYSIGIPICGTICVNTLYLVQGIDRLIAVLKPALYRQIQEHKLKASLVMAIFPIVYTVFILASAFIQRSNTIKLPVCTFYGALSGTTLSYFFNSTIAINVIVVFLYFAVWISLRKNATTKSIKRLFISLLITVSFVIGGWIITSAVSVILPKITTDPHTTMVVQLYGSLPAIFASTANPFIYYTRNAEYRQAMRGLFGLKTAVSQSEAVTTQSRTIVVTKSRHG